MLAMVEDALRTSDRGLFRHEALAAPNEHRTNRDGSMLWRLGLLELWLQHHV